MNAAATKVAVMPNNEGPRATLVLVEAPTLSQFDQFLMAIGMKQLADEKPTSPLEWNGKVVGLTVSLLGCLGILAAVMFWAASLASDLRHVQEKLSVQSVERERMILRRDQQINEINKRLSELEINAKVLQAAKRNER